MINTKNNGKPVSDQRVGGWGASENALNWNLCVNFTQNLLL